MKNYVRPGNSVTIVMPYAVNAGAGVLKGALFGVAVNTYGSGATGEIVTGGVFTELVKASGASEGWTPGTRLFWSDSNKNLTAVSTGNYCVGYSLDTVGTAVTTAGEVLIKPHAGTGV